MAITVLSPAKVNLFLKIVSRRPDGYHDLYSLVDIISLYDRIHFDDLAEDTIIVGDDKDVLPHDDGNTVYRAVRMLKETAGIKRGIRIFIEKSIPIGSGLGGPSSNAATALKALHDHWGLSMSTEELFAIGKKVGADVPLFLHGSSCIMEGIGDIITPVDLPGMWYVIVYPNISISTKTVYQSLRISLTKKLKDIKLMGNFSNPGDIAGILENDLEEVAIELCPQIQSIKNILKDRNALGSLMSGSGSSVFAIFENKTDAQLAVSAIKNSGRVFIAHSVQGGEDPA